MKKILCLLSLLVIASTAWSQTPHTDAWLKNYTDSLVRTQKLESKNVANVFQQGWNSKVTLLGSYANPAWITSLAGSKISGSISTATIPYANITGVPAGFALTDGNATTANGSAVDVGGTMTDDISIQNAGHLFAISTAHTTGQGARIELDDDGFRLINEFQGGVLPQGAILGIIDANSTVGAITSPSGSETKILFYDGADTGNLLFGTPTIIWDDGGSGDVTIGDDGLTINNTTSVFGSMFKADVSAGTITNDGLNILQLNALDWSIVTPGSSYLGNMGGSGLSFDGDNVHFHSYHETQLITDFGSGIYIGTGSTNYNSWISEVSDFAIVIGDFDGDVGSDGIAVLHIANDDATPAPPAIRLYENNESSNFSQFKLGSQSTNITYTLPTSLPVSSGIMLVNSSGIMSWLSGLPAGGSSGQLQINSSGSLVGDANLTWIPTQLSIGTAAASSPSIVLGNQNTDSHGQITVYGDTGGTDHVSFLSDIALGVSTIVDLSGNEFIKFNSTASAVNEFTITNAATGGFPRIEATGSNTDISIQMKGKGSAYTLQLTNNGTDFLYLAPGVIWNTVGDEFYIVGANTSGSTDAGGVVLRGGQSQNGRGGDIRLIPGTFSGSGTQGNMQFGGVGLTLSAWQGMQMGIYITNAASAPTGNPTSGGFLWIENGALKYRGTSGTVTTIAVP